MKKGDIILGISILAIAAILFGGIWLFERHGAGNHTETQVVVNIDGTLYGTYDLTTDQTVRIPTGEADTNIFEIRDGMVSMTEANCPDQLCVKQLSISHQGQMIICLPHRVTVEIR